MTDNGSIGHCGSHSTSYCTGGSPVFSSGEVLRTLDGRLYLSRSMKPVFYHRSGHIFYDGGCRNRIGCDTYCPADPSLYDLSMIAKFEDHEKLKKRGKWLYDARRRAWNIAKEVVKN